MILQYVIRCALLMALSASVYGDSTIYFVHNDHRGAPVMMTDSNANKVWEAEYKPFGEATINEDPDGDNVDVELNVRLPGQYFDEETGTYYNYYRDYDPRLGRYIQSDPIGLRGGLNTYGYVGQNPIMRIDPLGLEAAPAWVGMVTEVVTGIPVGDHYTRNDNQPNPPSTTSDLTSGPTGGEFTSYGETGTHNVGTSGNVDYRGNPGGAYEGHQYIYDNSGNLVNNDLNGGTFDFHSPGSNLPGHFFQDVIPWLVWGNTPFDPSTPSERACALLGMNCSNSCN